MKLVDLTVKSFLSELGSATPAPGGGSAAALAGAAAAGLCAMVCRLTLARESLQETWPRMTEALAESESLRARLLRLVDDDSKAYLDLAAALKLPRENPAQKETRRAAVQEAAGRAAAVPLETLEAVRDTVSIADLLAQKGNPSCRTDIGSAGALCRAAADAAAYNVRVNLPSIRDDALRGSLRDRARAALAEIRTAAERIAQRTEEHLEERSMQ